MLLKIILEVICKNIYRMKFCYLVIKVIECYFFLLVIYLDFLDIFVD